VVRSPSPSAWPFAITLCGRLATRFGKPAPASDAQPVISSDHPASRIVWHGCGNIASMQRPRSPASMPGPRTCASKNRRRVRCAAPSPTKSWACTGGRRSGARREHVRSNEGRSGSPRSAAHWVPRHRPSMPRGSDHTEHGVESGWGRRWLDG